MIGFRKVVAVVCALAAAPLAAQSATYPATPQGRLAAGFITAANGPDEEALVRYQEANFSPAALKRLSREERLAKSRQLRQDAGALTLDAVRSSSGSSLVLVVRGANLPGNTRLVMTFSFTSGASPKIDAVQVMSEAGG